MEKSNLRYHDIKYAERISLKLSQSQSKRLVREAKRLKTTKSEVIRSLIDTL